MQLEFKIEFPKHVSTPTISGYFGDDVIQEKPSELLACVDLDMKFYWGEVRRVVEAPALNLVVGVITNFGADSVPKNSK